MAVRVDDWKLIVSRRDPRKLHLFNLAVDPHESRDLAGHEPDRVATLRRELAAEQGRDPVEPK